MNIDLWRKKFDQQLKFNSAELRMVWIVSLRNKYPIIVRLIFLESFISFHREVENAPLRGIYYFMEK